MAALATAAADPGEASPGRMPSRSRVSSFIKTVFPRPVPGPRGISVRRNLKQRHPAAQQRTWDYVQSAVVVRHRLRYLERPAKSPEKPAFEGLFRCKTSRPPLPSPL